MWTGSNLKILGESPKWWFCSKILFFLEKSRILKISECRECVNFKLIVLLARIEVFWRHCDYSKYISGIVEVQTTLLKKTRTKHNYIFFHLGEIWFWNFQKFQKKSKFSTDRKSNWNFWFLNFRKFLLKNKNLNFPKFS